MKKLVVLMFVLMLSASCLCAAESWLELPDGLVSIESEAFADIPQSAVFVPRSVTILAPDAFGEGVQTIYGYAGSAAQSAASQAGKEFIPVDIQGITLEDAAAAAFEGDSVTLRASADAYVGDIALQITLLTKNGEEAASASGGALSARPAEGVYDVLVSAANGYDTQQRLFPSALTVVRPIAFAGDVIGADIGESVPLLSAAETRDVAVVSIGSGVVSASGLTVRGVQAGETAVTVRLLLEDGRSLFAEVPVQVYPPATAVKLPATLSVTAFETKTLSVSVTPQNANPKLKWSSSNEKVAVVDENGEVTGLSGGTAVITAKAASGKSASCTVTVKETKPTGLTVNELFVSLKPGGSMQLTHTITPAAAQNKYASYTSSDPAVATVDENGTVTAHSVGRATITLTSLAAGSVSDTCTVIVTAEGAKRLEGTVIGINPGHQKVPILTQYPIAPGSSTLKAGCKSGAHGVVSDKDEYEVNLEVSLILMRLLREEGATVVMTRTTNDVSLTNIQRAEILNSANVDAAIQVHCNGGAESAHGISSYYRSTGDWVDESRLLAQTLLDGMVASTGGYREGLHIYNQYMSLNWSFTPAALVELGYLTNKAEDRQLNDPAYQLRLAQGMVEGLCCYFGR